jgi:hypothetical protein
LPPKPACLLRTLTGTGQPDRPDAPRVGYAYGDVPIVRQAPTRCGGAPRFCWGCEGTLGGGRVGARESNRPAPACALTLSGSDRSLLQTREVARRADQLSGRDRLPALAHVWSYVVDGMTANAWSRGHGGRGGRSLRPSAGRHVGERLPDRSFGAG